MIAYIGRYKDTNDSLWVISISNPNYSGTYKELKMADNPLIISYSCNDDIFKPVKYSSATVRVLTSEILKYLYSANCDISVIITKDGSEYWRGWVTPNLYSQDYWSQADEIEINCIDYLSGLQYRKYKFTYYSYYSFIFDISKFENCNDILTQEASLPENPDSSTVYLISRTIGHPDTSSFYKYIFYFNGTTYEFNKTISDSMYDAINNFNELEFPGTVQALDSKYNTLEPKYSSDTEKYYYEGLSKIKFNISATFVNLIDEISYEEKGNSISAYTKISFIDFIKKCLNSYITGYILYCSSNLTELESYYIDEQSFKDDDSEIMTYKDILEGIMKYLGMTASMWQNKLIIINPNNLYLWTVIPEKYTFRQYYKELDDWTVSDIDTKFSSYKGVIAENNSTVEYNDCYNQFNVVANIKENGSNIEIETESSSNPYYDSTEFTSGDNVYRFYLYNPENIYNNNGLSNVHIVVNETESYDSGNVRFKYLCSGGNEKYSNSNIDLYKYYWYDKDILYPSPSSENAIRLKYKMNNFWENSAPSHIDSVQNKLLYDIAYHTYLKRHSIFYIQKDTYINSNANSDVHLILNLSVLYSKNPYTRTEDGDAITVPNTLVSSVSIDGSSKHKAFAGFYGKFKIGDYYWKGTQAYYEDVESGASLPGWSTEEEYFPIWIGDEDTSSIETKTYWSTMNTTKYEDNLGQTGYDIIIPQNTPVNGNIELWLYPPKNSSNTYNGEIYYEIYDYNGDFIGFSSTSNLSTIVAQSTDFQFCSITQIYNNTDQWYAFINNFTIDIVTNGYDLALNKENEDLKYSIDNDDDVSNSYQDLTFDFITYNANHNISNANNYVYLNNNKTAGKVVRDGYNLYPELHTLRQYYNHYSTPKLVHQNTFENSGFEPIDIITLPYLNGMKMYVGDIEYDCKYNTCNIKAYEL